MSGESAADTKNRPRPDRGLRRTAELVGIAITAVVAAVMLGFVLLYWAQDLPVASELYAAFRSFGRGMDAAFGTNVFRHPIMWQSMAVGVLVGVVAPLVGSFLVHREMALIGETLAHTAFAGVAIGILVTSSTGWNGSLLLVALAVGILGALVVQWLTERTDAYGDVPIAIMLSGSFAVGTLIISYGDGLTGVNIQGYLFGNLAVVTPEGARLMGALSLIVVAGVALTYKQLLFITFDEQAARVAQLNVTGYNTLLVVLTAVVVVGAMQVLGVILVAAMLVVPVAAASQIARSFRETMYLAVIFGQLSVIGGFAVSIGFGLPSGGSIVITAIAIYLASIVGSGFSVKAISAHG
ncbi:metal ABC transporter permease [Halorubrum lacusprofundi]|jgi:zinc transport system permease protein|uniref:ABC-3 protein n=1 Tax=Halorubrum lacusprofundi (strain ATCC 49239 / DSM 5036 / JCM 8891 / ACAM 34) TaxID=416348 RepID=B9LUX5_HALLT|nr:metal ABC transporter permease [Halorubrum lacusprofundi]ACM56452.1 ABC-3 protein [Halorubrum lacusprofundi ATCC 49239]MCG1005277.1 metal ABC transporter permease [Halorubrum lacusprofundi]